MAIALTLQALKYVHGRDNIYIFFPVQNKMVNYVSHHHLFHIATTLNWTILGSLCDMTANFYYLLTCLNFKFSNKYFNRQTFALHCVYIKYINLSKKLCNKNGSVITYHSRCNVIFVLSCAK